MKFTNLEGYDIVCNIYDNNTYAPFAEEYIKVLNPSGDPLHIATVDNNEDKFTFIRAKQASIKFLSTSEVNLNTFFLNGAGGNRYIVDIYVANPANPLFLGQTLPLFKGFLSLADSRSVFMDDYTYREVLLTAVDGLTILRDILLSKPDKSIPKGKFKIIEYLSWCLQKTGLQLPINVMNNLMEESFVGLPAYNNIYIDAKTFEGGTVGEFISCYDVLQRILNEQCYLTQWQQQWWIKRIDEYEGNPNYFDSYNYLGVFLGASSNIVNNKQIGLSLPITLIQPAAIISADWEHSFIKETFNYDAPKEAIDNIDFSRGGVIFIINPGPNKVAYTIDDWTVGIYLSSSTPGLDAAYIVRTIIDGYEKERYVRLKQPDGQVYYIKSNPLPVSTKDKFSISVDTRLGSNISGSGFRRSGVMQVRLYGNDGTNYFLHGPTSVDPTPRWVLTNSAFSTNTDFVYVEDDIADDETQWLTASCDAPPVPVDGDLVIWLINWGPNVAIAAETHFENLQFTYKPYINNSYQKYTGQYTKVSQGGDLRANRDKQIYISDSPRKLFKGALFKLVSGKYELTGNWYNGAIPSLRSGPADAQYLHPLGHIQAYEVWNQYRRLMRILDASLLGLDSGTDMPDLLHTYFINDHSPHTDNKSFILLHFDMNLYRCTWSGFFTEVFDAVLGKTYADAKEFKYIESR